MTVVDYSEVVYRLPVHKAIRQANVKDVSGLVVVRKEPNYLGRCTQWVVINAMPYKNKKQQEYWINKFKFMYNIDNLTKVLSIIPD